jgi:hypothetical protein
VTSLKIVPVVLVAALVALLIARSHSGTGQAAPTHSAAGQVAPTQSAASQIAPTSSATAAGSALTVGPSPVGRAIPPGFVGLSMEFRGLEEYVGDDPNALNPAFVQLIRDIDPDHPVLRIGGDSTDWTWWPVAHVTQPPGVKYDLTPDWMSVARALAGAVGGRLILGVNLEAGNRTLAAAEANAMVNRIGRSAIEALEIGNEPELYATFGWYKSVSGKQVPGRAPSYNEADFFHDYSSFAAAMPSVSLAGPSSGAATWLSELGPFLSAEHKVRLATVHAYPLKHCVVTADVTIPQLLSEDASHGLAEQLAPYVAAAARHRVPLRVDEINAVTCGGERGVSNAFASALWALDTMFEFARTGVSGVNIQTVPNTINEVVGSTYSDGTWQERVHPEFYGLIMFAQAAPAGARLLELSGPSRAGVKVWATRAPSGRVHVVLINKHLSVGQTVRLRILGVSGAARIEQLRAPSIVAEGGVTLGGQTFGAETTTGQLAGHAQTTTLSPSSGIYVVHIPPASATMLTFSP